MFQKRLARESGDSLALSALLSASSTTVALSTEEVKKRNLFVSKQLATNGLKAVNVGGDDSCYYRALSVGLYRHENQYLLL